MDLNEYSLEVVARCRRAEMRAAADRARLARVARPEAGPLLAPLGHALIWMGNRLSGRSRTP